jgi:hypothetical protein
LLVVVAISGCQQETTARPLRSKSTRGRHLPEKLHQDIRVAGGKGGNGMDLLRESRSPIVRAATKEQT